MTHAAATGFGSIRDRLDEAVRAPHVEAIAEQVKGVLQDALRNGLSLPGEFHVSLPDTYARRLLHRDPQGRYSAIVMTWGPGQGTAVHDHGGLWCVEGVVDGEIAVTQYQVQQDSDGYYRVTPIGSLLAGTGSAGCLIPPTDHHVLANARPARASVTLHVYGGDLCECQVFMPTANGRYASQLRTLSFHE